jgi:hypothetical protein
VDRAAVPKPRSASRGSQEVGLGNCAVADHVNGCEHQWEYGLVSANRSHPQLVAAPICDSCSEFQLFAARRNHSARTFNPKVTGSIPVRPTPLQLVGKRLHDSVCSLRSKRSALLGNSQATEAHRLTKGSVPPAPSVGHRSRLDRRADSTGAGKIETAVRE